MQINNLNPRSEIKKESKLAKQFQQFEHLLNELNYKEIPWELVSEFNNEIDQINAMPYDEKTLSKQIKKTQSNILKKLEKELKLVTKNHYRNLWLALGIGAFGVPLGVAFGTSLGSMAYIGIGMPIGMVIGIAVGSSMDKKAMDCGKQLDLEIKY